MSELYKRLIGTHQKQAQAILKLKDKFATSWWLSIDPGSNSCGYALWYGTDLQESGSLTTKGTIGPRLHELSLGLEAVIATHCEGWPAITLVEKVRCSTGHHYLTWSAGALIAAANSPTVLEVTSGAWQKNLDKTYVKGDQRDAEEIGKFAVTLLAESGTKARKARAPKTQVRSGKGR